MVSLQGYAGLGAKGLAAATGKAGTVAVLKSISLAVAGAAGAAAIVATAVLFSQLHNLNSANAVEPREPESSATGSSVPTGSD